MVQICPKEGGFILWISPAGWSFTLSAKKNPFKASWYGSGSYALRISRERSQAELSEFLHPTNRTFCCDGLTWHRLSVTVFPGLYFGTTSVITWQISVEYPMYTRRSLAKTRKCVSTFLWKESCLYASPKQSLRCAACALPHYLGCFSLEDDAHAPLKRDLCIVHE